MPKLPVALRVDSVTLGPGAGRAAEDGTGLGGAGAALAALAGDSGQPGTLAGAEVFWPGAPESPTRRKDSAGRPMERTASSAFGFLALGLPSRASPEPEPAPAPPPQLSVLHQPRAAPAPAPSALARPASARSRSPRRRDAQSPGRPASARTMLYHLPSQGVVLLSDQSAEAARKGVAWLAAHQEKERMRDEVRRDLWTLMAQAQGQQAEADGAFDALRLEAVDALNAGDIEASRDLIRKLRAGQRRRHRLSVLAAEGNVKLDWNLNPGGGRGGAAVHGGVHPPTAAALPDAAAEAAAPAEGAPCDGGAASGAVSASRPEPPGGGGARPAPAGAPGSSGGAAAAEEPGAKGVLRSSTAEAGSPGTREQPRRSVAFAAEGLGRDGDQGGRESRGGEQDSGDGNKHSTVADEKGAGAGAGAEAGAAQGSATFFPAE